MWTEEAIEKFISENSNYKLLKINSVNYVKMITLECDCKHIYTTKLMHFKNGHRCKKCMHRVGAKDQTLKYDYVKHFIEDCNYKLLSEEYINSNLKLLLRCPNNHEIYIDFSHFKDGKRCKHCSKRPYIDTEIFKSRVNVLEENNYTVLGEYVNNSTKLLMLHNDCNNQYMVAPNDFLRGKRCPICSESKGETKIRRFLESCNILYEREYSFENCKYKKNLLFDFYIPKYNLCIEYQGEQHYKPVDFKGSGLDDAMHQFKLNQKRDNIKREFCKNNNIKLIEVPYLDFDNIELILTNLMG